VLLLQTIELIALATHRNASAFIWNAMEVTATILEKSTSVGRQMGWISMIHYTELTVQCSLLGFFFSFCFYDIQNIIYQAKHALMQVLGNNSQWMIVNSTASVWLPPSSSTRRQLIHEIIITKAKDIIRCWPIPTNQRSLSVKILPDLSRITMNMNHGLLINGVH
jgi:hypothetical protein